MEYKLEATATYIELSATIENISNFCSFVITKFLWVGVMVPLLLLSIVNYYVYDGDESFYLPFPVLYVFRLVFLHFKMDFGCYVSHSVNVIFQQFSSTFQGCPLIGSRHLDICWLGLLKQRPLVRHCFIWIWLYPFWLDHVISSSAP